MDGFPRIRFSRSQWESVFDLLRNLGHTDVPSWSSFRRQRKKILQKVRPNRPVRHEKTLNDDNFCIIDPCESVALVSLLDE